MLLASHLRRSRHGIYYFRIVLPDPIAAVLGQRELVRSLGIRSPEIARKPGRIHRHASETYGHHSGDILLIPKALMRASFLTRIVAMLTIFCSVAHAEPSVASLEAKLAAGHNMEALVDIHKARELSPEVFAWLNAKAEEGVPPFQYEMGRRLIATQFEQGMKWYARGFIARSLDLSRCRDKDRNPTRMVIGTLYAPTQDLVLTGRSMYGQALEDAIKWEQGRKPKPTPQWICGADFIGGEEGEKLRRAKEEENVADAERLMSSSN